MQFTLCCSEMPFGCLGMSSHLVMVSSLDNFNLVDRIMYLLAHVFNVVPIMHPLGDRNTANKRQTTRKNGNCN